ncbi:MAG: hypothetical protein HRT68_11625 [Flavobacteriaceae bacterium]|nr:hypothetical protein [Flavobacteriaceae bacterium]
MKKSALYLLLIISCFTQAQTNSLLPYGPHHIGFKKFQTEVKTNATQYSFSYIYEGKLPLFINVWYPSEQIKKKSMTFGDYTKLPNINSIKKQLEREFMISYKHLSDGGYYFNQNTAGWETKNGSVQYIRRFNRLPIPVYKNVKPKPGQFPTIIYHHSKKGSPFENTVFCEYLASHGFVVITFNSSFLYYENEDEEDSYVNLGYKIPKYDSELANTLLQNVKLEAVQLPMVNPDQLIFAGYEYGAQVGLFNKAISYQPSTYITGTAPPFQLYLNYESTLEFSTREEVKQEAPTSFYYATLHERTSVKDSLKNAIPTIYFSSLKQESVSDGSQAYYPNFSFFKSIERTPSVFVTGKEELYKENTVSDLLLKYHLHTQFEFDDLEKLSQQYQRYLKTLTLTKDILEAFLNSKKEMKSLPEKHSKTHQFQFSKGFFK